jgi:hypothetical protein
MSPEELGLERAAAGRTPWAVTFPSLAKRLAATRYRALWVLALSGLMGFWIGITGFRDWQVAVETAQVIAGLVEYPADNPFYIYHVKLWTVLHQILAVPLWFGVSESALSEMVSGLLGMVSFQALAMFVYAFSRDGLYAIGSAFAIFLSRAAEFGGVYPIMLMGTTHTYGIIGLSTLVLVAALIGTGWYRLSGFLLGVMPAVHPSLGAWLGVIVAISVATDQRGRESFYPHRKKTPDPCFMEVRRALPWFVAGCGVSVVSLSLHLALTYDAAPVANEVLDPYISTLVTFWDGHRRPAHLNNPGVFLNFGALPLALTWLFFFADQLPRASVFLLRFVVVSTCLGIATIFVSWIPPDRLPASLVILMPLRVLNIAPMTFAALLFGLLGAYRQTLWAQLTALLLLVGLLLGDRSLLWRVLPREVTAALEGTVMDDGLNPLRVMAIAALALVLCVFVYRGSGTRAVSVPRGTDTAGVPDPRRILAALTTVRTASLGVLILYAVPALQSTEPRALFFRDRTHDPVFAAAAAGEGLLLTGGALHLIQLRTRRPVLLDGGGLDGLAYALEAGPAMNRILRDVYAVDLLNPPEEGRWTGSIPPATNRRAWERYSRQKWHEIRRTYNVTQVLTQDDWVLDLPVLAQTQDLRLYQIPD